MNEGPAGAGHLTIQTQLLNSNDNTHVGSIKASQARHKSLLDLDLQRVVEPVEEPA